MRPIGFGKRRNENSVIAPRDDAGRRRRCIAAEAIRDEPLGVEQRARARVPILGEIERPDDSIEKASDHRFGLSSAADSAGNPPPVVLDLERRRAPPAVLGRVRREDGSPRAVQRRSEQRLGDRIGVEPRAEVHDEQAIAERAAEEAQHERVLVEHRAVERAGLLRRITGSSRRSLIRSL